MPTSKEIRPNEETYNTRAVIGVLNLMLRELRKDGKKRKQQKFTFKEVCFLIELIFNRPRELLFVYLADYLHEDSGFKRIPFNGFNTRRLAFFHKILFFHNAKKAAIAAGYSPRSAKQTGYRIVKAIQGYKRMGSSSKFFKVE